MVFMSLFCHVILSKSLKPLAWTASGFPGQGGPTTVRQKANRRAQGCDRLPAS